MVMPRFVKHLQSPHTKSLTLVQHPIVDLEMKEIEHSLATAGVISFRNSIDLRGLFCSSGRRYRLMLVITFAWFGQFSGNNIASYYLPMMMNNVGITSTNLVLLMNAIYAVVGWIFATGGARFHDVFGRRKMLMGSCAGLSVCLAIVAGTAAKYEQTGSTQASAASIAFIFIFGAFFAFSFTPMQPIYPAEVLSSKLHPAHAPRRFHPTSYSNPSSDSANLLATIRRYESQGHDGLRHRVRLR